MNSTKANLIFDDSLVRDQNFEKSPKNNPDADPTIKKTVRKDLSHSST